MEKGVGRENNYKKKKTHIYVHYYTINEQKTCVNAIRVARHFACSKPAAGIYCIVMNVMIHKEIIITRMEERSKLAAKFHVFNFVYSLKKRNLRLN